MSMSIPLLHMIKINGASLLLWYKIAINSLYFDPATPMPAPSLNLNPSYKK